MTGSGKSNMGIYEKFAYIYANGVYADFSGQMAELLPSVLTRLEARPRMILDLACGEGTFAVAMAKRGFRVAGLDLSSRMLKFARDRAEEAKVGLDLVRGDMRCLPFADKFDLVTCWFDSLNYLVEPEDLRAAFIGVSHALRPGGLFIFDMNTVYGLAVNWREYPCYVQKDSPHIFEIHRQEYDFETNVATMKITGFIKKGNAWARIDEEHTERGYSQEEIRTHLTDLGFQAVACWHSFRDMSEAKHDSGRVWYIAKRRPA